MPQASPTAAVRSGAAGRRSGGRNATGRARDRLSATLTTENAPHDSDQATRTFDPFPLVPCGSSPTNIYSLGDVLPKTGENRFVWTIFTLSGGCESEIPPCPVSSFNVQSTEHVLGTVCEIQCFCLIENTVSHRTRTAMTAPYSPNILQRTTSNVRTAIFAPMQKVLSRRIP